MNWADYAILAVLTVSSLISLKRGFIKEALSMANWVLAFIIAVTFRDPLSSMFVAYIATPSLREMLAFAILFAATLIVGAMVNHLISELVRMTGLGGTDKFLGVLFGVVRGFVVIMAILLIVPPIIPINEDLWWKESLLIPHFLGVENWARAIFGDLVSIITGFFK